MRILVAADSFKDALGAPAVCNAIASGLRRAGHTAVIFPLADGGEGTAAVLSRHRDGQLETVTVHDPLLRPVAATYGRSADAKTAYIEMAAAAGLPLLQADERDPLLTSTFGVGELILSAYRGGARHFLLGIGGSATNDAGLGMAAALGYRFYTADGGLVDKPIGQDLLRVQHIDDRFVAINPTEITVEVLCDVTNPLFGPTGAAHVYAPQKGADGITVTALDRGLEHIGELLERHFLIKVSAVPGAGAAGGLGAGAMAFLGGRLVPGAETVLRHAGFAEAVATADLVVTGEGRLDGQTLSGKLIHTVCRAAGATPVVALCGSLDLQPADYDRLGLRAAFSIAPGAVTLERALADTAHNLERTAFSLGRLLGGTVAGK
jgi:glycerate kinase